MSSTARRDVLARPAPYRRQRRGVNLREPLNIWNRARLFDQPIEVGAFVVSFKPSDLFPRIRMLISSEFHFCSGHRLRCILKFASKL